MDGGWLTAGVFAVVGFWVLVMQVRNPVTPPARREPGSADQRLIVQGFPWWLLLLVGLGGGAAYLVGALRNGHAWWWLVVVAIVAWVAAAVVKKARDDGRAWTARLPGSPG